MTYRKSYRIEANLGVLSQDEGILDRHSEVMGMLATIKESIVPAKEISSSLLEEHRRDMQEALRLKTELDSIYEAIERTKREIATLRYAGAQGKEITRVTDELGAIVKTGEYTNPRATDYILKTLLERRHMIVRHWLKDASPLAGFAVETGTDGVALKFSDLLADHDLDRGVPQYTYDIRTSGRRTEKKTSAIPRIVLGAVLEGEAEIRIWTTREGVASEPIVVHVQGKPGGTYAISRIERS